MQRLVYSVILSLILLSCRDSDSTSDNKNPTPIRNQSLVFTAIDPSAYPWAASVFQLDLKEGKVERLLSGESGDAALFSSGQDILFFNRTDESQNYRVLSLTGENPHISEQQNFARGESGDPHDALFLGDDRVLLAHYVQGTVTLMKQSTGEELTSIAADWDLPEGIRLRPEALVSAAAQGRSFVYVVHQALNFSNGLLTADGTQRVFVLEDKGGQLTAVDLDPNLPKVQGIRLKGSFPVPVRFAGREKILLVSMCSRLVAPSTDPAQACVNALEEIDPNTQTSSTVWDLTGSGLYMNGPVTAGPDADTFFANVERELGPQSFEKQVVRIDAKAQTATSIYSFTESSYGIWGTFFDISTKTLYIGDVGTQSLGKFVVVPESGERSEIPLELVPYAGTFVAAP